ncbi:MAG: hypothetical protein RMI01_09310 [Thermodesulfovibrio sp.]|nr:hypothetical protein [Thermodesulfovibrio sp.]
MYKEGRRFEYRVIEDLKDLGFKVIRNKLSRKPDLILINATYPFLEVKKTVRKGNVECYRIENIFDFLRKFEFSKEKITKRNLEWTTITKEERKLVIYHPLVLDLDYLRDFEQDVFMKYDAIMRFAMLRG